MRISRGSFFKFYLTLARAGLALEYLWPALWPAVGLAGLFMAAALLNLFALVPVWLHAGLVLLFLIGFFGALQKAVARFPKVRDGAARHRIEVNSGLDHRPLESLGDDLAIGADDANTVALWQAHRRRMEEQARRLRLRLPRAGLAGRDPWAVRAGIAALLVVGVFAAGSDGFSRLGRALLPELSALAGAETTRLNLWITPPAYTGEAPVVLKTGGGAGNAGNGPAPVDGRQSYIDIPAGSAVLAQVSGGGGLPELRVDEEAEPFGRVEADRYHLETTLDKGSRLAVYQRGRELAAWELNVRQDQAPTIEITAAAETSRQLRLRVPYASQDDYGLKSVTISMRRIDGTAIPGGADEVILRLPLPGGNRKLVKGKSNHDLVAHVWAGLPVLVHLLATDESGQTGVSAVEPVVLPERRFSHPVAREIYELRKRLTAKDRDQRLGILKLDQIAEYPDRFAGNYTVYLSLRVARERLRQDKRDAAVAEVQQMLWNTALRLEEGRTSDASRDLAAAQRALAEALDRNADIKELERLMNEVQKALQKFMSSLMRELRQRGQLPPTDPNAEVTNMQDLQRLLDRMRELMRQGSREAAKQLMAELQRMLQSLRGALARRGQQSEEARRAQQTMRELRAIIRRQQKLLDETFRRTRPGNRGRPGEERSEANTDGLDEQQAIRRELGKMMRKFGEQAGEIPKGLGDAERSMRRSERAFGQGRPGDSIDPQNQALDALRRGAQNSARALARRLGRGGIGRGRFDPRGGRFGAFTGPRLRGLRPGNRDPFGRQLEEGSSGTATGRVKIPEESEIQRARKILNELRKRLGDQWRPEVELDYIERLLKRF
ncbi:MAG: DUF4175 family protein [Rhodospirillales bacterium]